jgi:hypothetical protein
VRSRLIKERTMSDPYRTDPNASSHPGAPPGGAAEVLEHAYTTPDPDPADVPDEGGSGARHSGATTTPTAGWPPDGTAAGRLARETGRRITATYNDRSKRLDNLGKAVAQRESDLAQAKRETAGPAGKGALLQMAGRLHRARMELAQLQASR